MQVATCLHQVEGSWHENGGRVQKEPRLQVMTRDQGPLLHPEHRALNHACEEIQIVTQRGACRCVVRGVRARRGPGSELGEKVLTC